MITRIDKSKIHGNGLFATQYIKKGTSVGRVFDFKKETLTGSYVNHSKDFNVEISTDNLGYLLIATRDIDPGEEITADYQQCYNKLRLHNHPMKDKIDLSVL